MITVIIGATRSGKSALAEDLAAQSHAPVVYVAASSDDPAMRRHEDPELAQRIARHQLRRPCHWRTLEQDPLTALETVASSSTVLVDSLGSWITALVEREGLWTDAAVASLTKAERQGTDRLLARVEIFAQAAQQRQGTVIVVAELAGAGLAAAGAGTRRWLDLLGEATQLLARQADPVLLVVAGRALRLPPTAGAHAPPDRTADPIAADPVAADPAGADPVGAPSVDTHRATASASCEDCPDAVHPAAPDATPEQLRALRFHGDELARRHGQLTSSQTMTLDFAVSVYPAPPPTWIQAALYEGVAHSTRYPDEHAVIEAVAQRHARRPEEVLLASGSAELFWLLAQALKPRAPTCVHPTFTEADVALRSLGRPPICTLRDQRTFALLPRAIPEASDFVVITNPNNPTGNIDPAALIAPLARGDRTLVVDEAFMEFDPQERESLAARRDLPGLVVLRTLTKLWSIPGIRAGYLLGPAPLVARLRAARPPWTVSTPALAALLAWAQAPANVAEYRCAQIVRRRARLAGQLAALPAVRVWPSGANFLLVATPGAEEVRTELASRGVFVRPGWTFPGLSRDYLRIAVRNEPDHAVLLEHLHTILRVDTTTRAMT